MMGDIAAYVTRLRGECIGKVKKEEKETILFRGQEAPYPLVPTAKRVLLGGSDKDHVEKAQKIEGSHRSEMECMALLRHYGAPSVALDFTRSFYVALYFACKNEKQDGRVFVVSLEEHKENSLEDFFKKIVIGRRHLLWIDVCWCKKQCVSLKEDTNVEYIDIPWKRKKDILDFLETEGIEELSIYPDIPGYAKSLADASAERMNFFNTGVNFHQRGNLDEAIKWYTKAIEGFTKAKLNPKHAEAYYNRGNAYVEKGNLDKAIEDYTEAMKINPQFAAAYYNKGMAYFKQERYDEAIEDYTKAIEIDPKHMDAYINRGNAYQVNKDYGNAIKDFTKVIEINPREMI